jgi:hypothetical protein
MNLTLRSTCGSDATTGILTVGTLTLHTIEPPWRGNRTDVSCVPAGEYRLLPYVSPKHGATWRLHNPLLGIYGTTFVPEGGRSEVEIHSGNLASQSEGCILVGLSANEMLDPSTNEVEPAVLDSIVALNRLRDLMDGSSEEDVLTIYRDGLYAPTLL